MLLNGDCGFNCQYLTSRVRFTPIEVDELVPGCATLPAVMFQAFRRATACGPVLAPSSTSDQVNAPIRCWYPEWLHQGRRR